MNLMVASANDEQIEKFSLKIGDVIITKDSETANDIAVPAVVKEELENVVCGYHLSVLRPDAKLVGEYLFRVLQCKSINIQFELCSNGVTRVGLGVYDLKKAQIPIPPISEQTAIFSHIEAETAIINKTIATIEKEIVLVQEYRTALIAEAVTGKIDVREYCLHQDFSRLEDEQYLEEDSDNIEEETIINNNEDDI
jgi:type I restriction enzyme S subunit